VWSRDPCSNDECPGLRRAFCNPRPSSFRARYPSSDPRMGCLPVYVHHKMNETEKTEVVRVLYLFVNISSYSHN
jgi:hypothetical protein